MDIATVLFTYNRPNHTRSVLEALKSNTDLPQKLFVFHDGKKKSTDENRWDLVEQIVREIDWCNTEVITSEKNKGLAKSIVDGVNYVLERYDAVIVLEDDCVPARCFMKFMIQAFEQYQNNKEVCSISGYAWPIDIKRGEAVDAYFTGRFSSWGWGTWKDRWQEYRQDFDIVNRLMSNKQSSKMLLQWGSDLEKMLNDRIAGKNDSWAVFMALNIIENGGKCLTPYRSLIQNIGTDGTGVHCGETSEYDVEIDSTIRQSFNLPSITDFKISVKIAFEKFLGNCFGNTRGDNTKQHVLVYGAGSFLRRNSNVLNERFYVEAIIDSYKSGYYGEVPILSPEKITSFTGLPIIIMLMDLNLCQHIRDMLINEYMVDGNCILYGGDYF